MGLPILSPVPLENVQLIIIPVVFLALVLLVLGLRLVSRRLVRARLALNDWLMILAVLCLTAKTAIQIWAKLTVPEGVPDDTLSQDMVEATLKSYIANNILWCSTMALVKLSALHLFLTIFPGKNFHRYVYFVMALNVFWWIAMVITVFVICQPFPYTWNWSVEGECGDVMAAYLAESVINLVLDAVVVALPLPMLRRLNIKRPRKIQLMIIFSLGVLVTVISILRVVSISLVDFDDIQYRSFWLDLFATLEPALACIIACLPLLHPVYTRISTTFVEIKHKHSVFSKNGKFRKSLTPSWKTSRSKFSTTKSTIGNQTKRITQLYSGLFPSSGNYTAEVISGHTTEHSARSGARDITVDYTVDVDSVERLRTIAASETSDSA